MDRFNNDRHQEAVVAARRRRAEGDARAVVLEAAQARRRAVYRADVPFAAPGPVRRLPRSGPERDALVRAVQEAVQRNESHKKIATRLGFDVPQIVYLCKRHGIRKGVDG